MRRKKRRNGTRRAVAAAVLSVAFGAANGWAQSAPFETDAPTRPQTAPFGSERIQTTSRAQTTHYESVWTRQIPNRPTRRANGRRFGRTFAPPQTAANASVPTQVNPVPVTTRRVAPNAAAPPLETPPVREAVPIPGTSPLEIAPPTNRRALNVVARPGSDSEENVAPPSEPPLETPPVRGAVPIPRTSPLEIAPPTNRRALNAVAKPGSDSEANVAPPSGTPLETPLRPERSSDRARPGALENERDATTEEVQEAALDVLLRDVDLNDKPTGDGASHWSRLVSDGDDSAPERFALGKKLFVERRLSNDGSVSCATCRDASRGFADDRPTSEGVGERFVARNSLSAACSAFFYRLFGDGKSPNLED